MPLQHLMTLQVRSRSISEFENQRTTDFATEAKQLLAEMRSEHEAYLAFIQALLFSDVPFHGSVSAALYDRGFIYRDENGHCQFLSRPAKDALTHLWAHEGQAALPVPGAEAR